MSIPIMESAYHRISTLKVCFPVARLLLAVYNERHVLMTKWESTQSFKGIRKWFHYLPRFISVHLLKQNKLVVEMNHFGPCSS